MKPYVTRPNEYLEPRIGKDGVSAWPARTVIDVFQSTVERFPNEPALYYKQIHEGKVANDYTMISFQGYWNLCMKFAKTLIKLDIPMFEVVNILGFNSTEWFIANTGAILAGCIAAGIYTTNLPEACRYISHHSKAPIVVLEGNKQLEKYTQMVHTLPALKAIVVWGETINPELARKCAPIKVYSWEEFLVYGQDLEDSVMNSRWANIRPGNCCTIIYTSGTTGPPKATMISHDNITWTTRNMIDHYFDLNHTDRVISYLPLSHIAAQMIDLHCMMTIGGSTWFAQPDALKGSLTQTMKEVRPTIFFGVPRVWEKIEEKMIQLGRETTGVLKMLSTWAKAMGKEKNRRAQYGGEGGAPCGFSCANTLILQKIKLALGLDQVKGCVTGAAPISAETLWYFASLDIPIYEGFGQSECTGPHTFSGPRCWKIGTCGRPLYGTESRIDPITGELQYRGRHIFMGYMYMEKETQATIDPEGYLHSGDVAIFDTDHDPKIPSPSGFLTITGRIKELIITAGGENIPPAIIENEMKAAMLAVSNVMVIGDQRKFLTMLVSLKVEMDSETGLPTDRLAPDALFIGKQIGSLVQTYSEAKTDPKWKDYITKGMKQGNTKTTSNAQIIQKWMWLPEDFSEKNGDLTPTLKLKRSVVVGKYRELIDSMYSDV